MSSIVVSGDTSGTVTLQAPAVAGSTTLTLPSTSGSVVIGTTPSGTIVGTTDTQTLTNKTLGNTVVQASNAAPAFSAYISSTQTLPINTITKVQLNTKSFDTTNNFDNVTNFRFTPTVAGYYIFTGQVYNATQVSLLPEIYKNGAAVAFGTMSAPSASNGNNGSNVCTILFMNGSTDFVEFYVASIAVASTLAAGPNANYFAGAMIRSA